MANEPENPLAFPQPCDAEGRMSMVQDVGMTLRDYFAAKILQGWISTYGVESSFPIGDSQRAIAEQSYLMADAMLKARR